MSSSQPNLHHVGIIVPDLDQVRLLMDLLKLDPGRTQYVPQYDADCYFTRGENGVIEFIVPRSGVLTKFNKGLGGLHHIAFQVEDLDQHSAEMRSKGIELLEAKPVDAGPLLINFLPRAYTRGIVVELVQLKPDEPQ